jgi:hypothetical protein
MGFTFFRPCRKGGWVGCHFDKATWFVMKTGGWFRCLCRADFRRPARHFLGLTRLFGSRVAVMVAAGEDWSDF